MGTLLARRICLAATATALACASILAANQSELSKNDTDIRAALTLQRKLLVDSVARGSAAGVAALFAADAKLMISDHDAIIGRESIEKAWNVAFGSGTVARLVINPEDIEGFGGELLAETGTLLMLSKDGKEFARDNYVIVWRQEGKTWLIYREIGSTRSGPASALDRVGFVREYRTQFTMLSRPKFNSRLGEVTTVFGNKKASSIKSGGKLPYPDGSILVMEFASALKDSRGTVLYCPDGAPQKGSVLHVDFMRREAGYGVAYGKNRAGEWEFASYREDGSYVTPPAASGTCASCHLSNAGAENDFVFPLRNP